MSGFEVAGLVLGTVPLLINGLEHYAEGVNVVRSMKNYDCVFADINSSFAASLSIYEASCWRLLAPLNLSDAQMKVLLSESDDDKRQQAWRDADLQQRLTVRLGPSCRVYLAALLTLRKRILKLAHKLRLGSDFRPPWILSDGTIYYKAREQFFGNVWIRIKGGFESNKCSALINAIDNDIAKINQLTDIALEVEPLRLERDRRRKAKVWANIRDSAQSLSEILRLKWTSPCTCRCSHRANMLLKAQMDDEADSDYEAEHSRFELLLVFDKTTSAVPAVAYKWRDVEIHCSEIVRAKTKPSPPKGVRFHISTSTNQTATAATPRGALSATQIDNLCRSLASQTSVNCCLGYLEDHLRRHHLFLISGLGAQHEVVPDASLHHLLLETGQVMLGPRMKCSVALTLALAVLRLYDTPWLVPSWDLCDIYFLRDARGNYLLDRPYVSFPIGTPAAVKSQRAYRRRLVKNEIVFALGVALIELSYAKALHNLTEAPDLDENGNRDIMTEYATVTRLAGNLHQRELPNYAKATTRCINFNFETLAYDLNDQDFRARFYEGVVMPLRADWEYATG